MKKDVLINLKNTNPDHQLVKNIPLETILQLDDGHNYTKEELDNIRE